MINRLLTFLRIDPAQFRVLLKTGVAIDFRSGLSPSARRQGSSPRAVAASILVSYGMLGFFSSFFILMNPDTFVTGSMLCTVILLFVSTAVMIDFQSLIFSTDDFLVVGYRPVTSRTFFAARVGNVLVHIGLMTLALMLFPFFAFLFAHGFKPVLALATLAAALLEAAVIACAAILFYATVLRFTLPERLRTVLTYVQFLFSLAIYGSGFAMTTLFNPRTLGGIHFVREWWMLVIPSTWFSGFLTLADGDFSLFPFLAAGLACLVLLIMVRSLTGRVSATFMNRLSELCFTTEKTKPMKERKAGRSFTFLKYETRSAFILMKSQFRYERNLRMSLLATLPIVLLYFYGGVKNATGSLDPFTAAAAHLAKLNIAYFGLAFFPLIMLQTLTQSEGFRAAWIFYTSPSDKGKIVLALKNVVLALFVIPYLVIMGILLSIYSTTLLHGAAHMVLLFMLSNIMLQAFILYKPALPFSQTANRRTRMLSTFLFMIVGVIIIQLYLNMALRFVYPSALATVLFGLCFLLITGVLELAVQRRIRRKLANAQFEE
jgi:hypothetical protein